MSEKRSVSAEQIAYDIAYFILPQYVYQRLEKIKELNATPIMGGVFFYIMACQMRELEPSKETAVRFRWHFGDFDAQTKFTALEYPAPTAIDLSDKDPLELIESGELPVLAPYFSVILHGESVPPNYYILGQSPLPGVTTIRTVLEDGANCNCGPGPEPELETFLEAVREQRA